MSVGLTAPAAAQADLDAATLRIAALEAAVAGLAVAVPTLTDSPDGTAVPDTATRIVLHGDVWTLNAGGQVAKNGIVDSVTNSVTKLVVWKGAVYQTAHTLWWFSTGATGATAWTAAPRDPRIPVTPAATTQTGTAPAQAAAAGFGRLLLADDFTSLDVGDARATRSGHAWYNDFPMWPSAPADWQSHYSQAGSIATLTATRADNWWSASIISDIGEGTKSFLFGYFEALILADMGSSGCWPAWWLFSQSHTATNGGPNWSEMDIMEGQGNDAGAVFCTVHQWNSGQQNGNARVPLPAGFDWTKWHKWGLLHVPGKVTWFLDDQPISSAPTFAINDTDKVSLVLGAQANGWSGNLVPAGVDAIHMQVDWVNAWGA